MPLRGRENVACLKAFPIQMLMREILGAQQQQQQQTSNLAPTQAEDTEADVVRDADTCADAVEDTYLVAFVVADTDAVAERVTYAVAATHAVKRYMCSCICSVSYRFICTATDTFVVRQLTTYVLRSAGS